QENSLDSKQLSALNERLIKIANQMEKTQIADYVMLLNKPRRLIAINLLFGIARGVGIAIGFTLFTALILYGLRLLGALNLPIIGDFVADIVKIVQVQLEGRAF
ncbi:MAG: hypothetical protein K0Q81_2133, partial [Paenibacillus sp.]|nr:hypothetical protein [Paenibacillus sp.]